MRTDRIQNVKSKRPQNGLSVDTHGLDDTAGAKTPTEYSPMPSEVPSESHFDTRRPSIPARPTDSSPLPSEEPSDPPFDARRSSIPAKATDSDAEQKPKPPKKGKKKKGKKSEVAVLRSRGDDES